MLIRKKSVIILSLLLIIPKVWSATEDVIYQCDFEDVSKHSTWTLNQVANASRTPDSRWYIGKAGSFGGEGNGLFISSEGSASGDAVYAAGNDELVTAYTTVHLAKGTYQLRFNWRAYTKGGMEGLYALVCPGDSKTFSNKGGAGTLPTALENYKVHKVDNCLHNQKFWRYDQYDFTIFSEGDYKLCFYWISRTGRVCPPSGCIDNIKIVQPNSCALPQHFSYKLDSADVHNVTFSWQGDADYYDFIYYDNVNKTWYDSITKDTSFYVQGFNEGVHLLLVQAHCQNGDKETTSGYATYQQFLYYPGDRCLDYMHLTSKNCFTSATDGSGDPHDPSIPGVIDFGYQSALSCHTLHYVDDEIDWNTLMDNDSVLTTKPDGSILSVRLGDKLAGGYSNRLRYEFVPTDPTNSILKLKYAIVLQDAGHESEMQPRFTINITANGGAIRKNCGSEDFRAGFASSLYEDDSRLWHFSNAGYYWREWDTLAINLQQYLNKKIVVTIEAHDCWMNGHMGYAYLTLECASSELLGESCGEGNPTTEVSAPSGFNYSWFKKSDPSIQLSDQQSYRIPDGDTAIYCVDVLSKTKTGCGYTLDVCGAPRVPYADMKPKRISSCHNVYRFYNHSRVIRKSIYGDTLSLSTDRLSSLYWDWGDGETLYSMADSVDHVFPDSGGDITVALTAGVGISGDTCTKTYTYKIHMEDLTYLDRYVKLTEGQYYKGSNRTRDTVETTIDDEGCERIEHITVFPKYYPVTDTLCEGKVYSIGDQVFTTGGNYEVKLKKMALDSLGNRLADPQGNFLDSIVQLNLQEITMPRYVARDTFVVCGDAAQASVALMITDKGTMSDAAVVMSQMAREAGFDSIYYAQPYNDDGNLVIMIPLPSGIRPDYYPASLTFYSEHCEIPSENMILQVNYPASLLSEISTNKDGFITLRKNDLMDEFVNYTWYRDGQKVYEGSEPYIGATRSSDYGAEYTVLLTRKDGVSIPSCGYRYGIGTALDDVYSSCLVYPTFVGSGEAIHFSELVDAKLYSAMGYCVQSVNNTSAMEAPQMSGIYFLVINNREQIVKICVK